MIRPAVTLLTVLVLAFLGIVWITLQWHPQGEPLAAPPDRNADLLDLTGTTARLAGEDYLRTAVAYSQTIYAAAQDKDRPGAVVLVRDDDPRTAITATRLQHFPVNAPMLFVTDEGTTLPQATRDELERLGPEGGFRLHELQVGGLPGAACVSLVRGEEWGLYNSAYDETLSMLAPGMVIISELLKVAAEEGATTFDLLRGGEEYKYRFGAEDRQLLTAAFQRS